MDPDGRFCSANRRSWTDLVTNRVWLEGITDSDSIGLMNAQSDFPPQLMASYMHEAMHYTVFDSPVGSCLARLYMASLLGFAEQEDHPWSRTLIVKSGRLGAATQAKADRALFRYDFVVEMMRPLAEGLALFSEFDAIARASGAQEIVTNSC